MVFDVSANKLVISVNEPFIQGKWFLMEEYLPDLVLGFEPSHKWLAIVKQVADYFANKHVEEESSSIVEVFGKQFVKGLSAETWYDQWVTFGVTFKAPPYVFVTGYTRHGQNAHLEDPNNRDYSDGVKTDRFCWRFKSSYSGTSGIHWRA